MASSTSRVSLLILEQLAHGEQRVLSLIVAVGRMLTRTAAVKGDLATTVKTALRALVAAQEVVDTDGVYSLRKHK
jgi:hypothetical protein